MIMYAVNTVLDVVSMVVCASCLSSLYLLLLLLMLICGMRMPWFGLLMHVVTWVVLLVYMRVVCVGIV